MLDATFTLGRVAGVRIGLNWTWLLVFALITWTLTASAFPAQNPGLGEATYLAMGIAASGFFFAAILAHELGHAVQARREGMEIEGITLWLFGGVATFKGHFPGGGAELRIALAGPLVTAVVGGLLVGVAATISLPPEVDGTIAWLGYTNLVLLAFNLLPALPLDGGRVLRAALWHRSGDYERATRLAATIARGFGYVLIAWGIVLLIFQGVFSGVWIAFIGWFVLVAAASEERFARMKRTFEGATVAELMSRDPVTVAPDLSLEHVVDRVIWSSRYTTYPVVENDRTVGLLPFRSVAAVPPPDWATRTVSDCMIPLEGVPVLSETTPLEEAIGALGESDLGRALVLDGDRLVGLLSITDVARALELGVTSRRSRIGDRADRR
ncbi:MAG TPA: site-2 protease family protein [Gaiellaceae bacterium]|nr:site-2 protease family protein [Gaiellaceae bacterium]